MTEQEIAINFLRWTQGVFSWSNIHKSWYSHYQLKYYTCEELYKLYEQQTFNK